jgi:hypothetical protein
MWAQQRQQQQQRWPLQQNVQEEEGDEEFVSCKAWSPHSSKTSLKVWVGEEE